MIFTIFQFWSYSCPPPSPTPLYHPLLEYKFSIHELCINKNQFQSFKINSVLQLWICMKLQCISKKSRPPPLKNPVLRGCVQDLGFLPKKFLFLAKNWSRKTKRRKHLFLVVPCSIPAWSIRYFFHQNTYCIPGIPGLY